ncbi:alkene reductase [Nocardioides pacificus]
MTDLFTPAASPLGELPHRLVMAPLTRNRAGEGEVPTELAVEYYAQRASAAFIITEGTQPSAVGQGYAGTPGIHTPQQIAGWRQVGDAVHARGGRIVMQLMHAGRIGHPDNKHGAETVGPSAIAAPGQIFTGTGMQPYPIPRALTTEELPGIVEEFVQAGRNAVEAGLDGVEIHAANGYLLHQFLAPSANRRSDEYGESPANRARLTIEVAQSLAAAIGPERVGIRISPAHNVQGATEEDPADLEATYTTLVEAIAPLGLAYLSILADPRAELVQHLRKRFDGFTVVNDGFGTITTHDVAQAFLDEDLADAVAVGRPFLANPDLPRRWALGTELNKPDSRTYYTGGAEGYTDYPFLEG